MMQPLNFDKRPLIICSNSGDESIALVQWAYEAALQQVQVLRIDTGWAAERWSKQVELAEAHAQACGFKTETIVSQISFADAVLGRGEFPSEKFQWCSALLKGLPFLDWLDTWDPACQAIILIAKRRSAAKAHRTLSEWIDKCEFHNDRTVWHPLLDIETKERDTLLLRAGFTPLNHRSLECDPCVNSNLSDLKRLTEFDIRKIQELEASIQASMFTDINEFISKDERALTEEKFEDSSDNKQQQKLHSIGIRELIKLAKEMDEKILDNIDKNYLDLFYRGCGNHFGCGL